MPLGTSGLLSFPIHVEIRRRVPLGVVKQIGENLRLSSVRV